MEPLRINAPAVTAVKWPTERRQRSRNKIFTPAYASFNGANALDLHEILDLHEEGFAVQAPVATNLEHRVNLRLVLSEAPSPISASGTVVWSDGARLGIQLAPLAPEELKKLQQWLFLNAMNGAADEVAAGSIAIADEELDGLADRSSLLNALDAVQREVRAQAAEPEAVLRLIADRARSFTAATGSAIAVLQGDDMVCRATSGTSTPPVGASFQTGSGFSGECVRRRTLLRCDDTESDVRVDSESCRMLRIRSMLAVPLLSNGSVVGILEVFSPSPHAFDERDEEVMVRMGEFAASVIREEKAKPSASSRFFPFADSLNHDTHNIPLQRSHVLLLIAVAALIALVLGYLLAPWLERFFTPPPRLAALVPIEQPVLKTVAQKPAPRAPLSATTLDQMRKLAEDGDPSAQFSMGTHYAIGDGVKLDSAEAARWFTKAADQGHVLAQDLMGAYYEVGRGVPKDLRKAYFWSLLGSAGNSQTSKHRVVTLAASLAQADVEAARKDAEEWTHQHSTAAKSVAPATP